MTRVKICGLTQAEHALVAGQAGADFIGMVFAESRRQVSVGKARQIVTAIHSLKKHPAVVGVFVNSVTAEINRIAEDCQLDWVQLSGHESWAYCQEIKKPVIKVIHISPSTTVEEVLSNIETGYRTLAKKEFVCLLDSTYGGSGRTFDWNVAVEVAARFSVIVAGGLTPNNVGQLLKTAKPWGVDVSSGVETNGQKDPAKIRAFVEAVRSVQ